MDRESRWLRRQIPAQVNSGPANTLPDRAVSPAANCPGAQQAGCGCQHLPVWEMGQSNTVMVTFWSHLGRQKLTLYCSYMWDTLTHSCIITWNSNLLSVCSMLKLLYITFPCRIKPQGAQLCLTSILNTFYLRNERKFLCHVSSSWQTYR